MTPDVNKVAEELEGSCLELENVLREYGTTLEDMPAWWLVDLDNHVMCCEQCGWWSESSEFNDDQICEDCEEDE